MSKYSFLVSAKEPEYFQVNEYIRLAKHGGWLVGESIEQEEIAKVQSKATLQAVQLARKISKVKDIDIDTAFGLLQAGSFSDGELMGEFADDMLSMVEAENGTEALNARLITAFIRSRGEGEISGEWKPLSDWSIEDTKELPRPLTKGIFDFINAEREEESVGTAKKAQKKTDSATLKG
jgi:hypothetical protein